MTYSREEFIQIIVNKLYKETSNPNHLSVEVIRNLAYLVEWKYVLSFHKKVTDIKWSLNISPVFSFNVSIIEQTYPDFSAVCDDYDLTLVIKFVLHKYLIKYEGKLTELLHLVACTYPCHFTERGNYIDFISCAIDYQNQESKHDFSLTARNVYG